MNRRGNEMNGENEEEKEREVVGRPIISEK